MNQAFNELLGDVLAGEISIGKLTRREEVFEGNRLSRKWDRLLLVDCNAEITPRVEGTTMILKTLLEVLHVVKCAEDSGKAESKD